MARGKPPLNSKQGLHSYFIILTNRGVLDEEDVGNACGSETLKRKGRSERLSFATRPLHHRSPLLSATASHHGVRISFSSRTPEFFLFAGLAHVYKISSTSPRHLLIRLWGFRVQCHWLLWRARLQFPLPQWEAQHKAYKSSIMGAKFAYHRRTMF